MDSLLASLQTTLEANGTIAALTDVRFQIIGRREDGGEYPEPTDIHRYAVVLTPASRRRVKSLNGPTCRHLAANVGCWIKVGWEDSDAFKGRGSDLGLDDFCDAVEEALAHSRLGDGELMNPNEEEALGEGEYITAANDENLRGVGYPFTARRKL